MEASEPMMPDAWATTLWAMSNTPMTRFQVLVTSKIAAADLNTHLKIIQVSTSCRLLRSVIIWINSSVITMARITPAIGTMMELERFWIMLKISPFHPCGVWPTCVAMSATCRFTLSNIPVKFPMMPPTSISLSQLVRASNKKSIRCQPPFCPSRCAREGARISAGYDQTVNRPDSRGTSTMPDDGDACARHELFHALAFGPRIVVAISLQQVDDAPHAETGTEGDNEGLENGDCLIEKFHK